MNSGEPQMRPDGSRLSFILKLSAHHYLLSTLVDMAATLAMFTFDLGVS